MAKGEDLRNALRRNRAETKSVQPEQSTILDETIESSMNPPELEIKEEPALESETVPTKEKEEAAPAPEPTTKAEEAKIPAKEKPKKRTTQAKGKKEVSEEKKPATTEKTAIEEFAQWQLSMQSNNKKTVHINILCTEKARQNIDAMTTQLCFKTRNDLLNTIMEKITAEDIIHLLNQ